MKISDVVEVLGCSVVCGEQFLDLEVDNACTDRNGEFPRYKDRRNARNKMYIVCQRQSRN